jgi:hypothetical protein
MSKQTDWPTGGRRLTKAQRAEILRVYQEESLEAATELAVSLGLSSMYAWKLAHAMGMMPRERKYWSPRLREIGQ